MLVPGWGRLYTGRPMKTTLTLFVIVFTVALGAADSRADGSAVARSVSTASASDPDRVTAAGRTGAAGPSGPSGVAVDDVLTMMTVVPGAPGDPHSRAHRWDRERGAQRIAEAIAETAPDREWAARMAVYAIHESGLHVECVEGDGGESLGPFQLKGVSRKVACDPKVAAPVWLAMARASADHCRALPAFERMAELVSGNCGHGHQLARLREAYVLSALAKLSEVESAKTPHE